MNKAIKSHFGRLLIVALAMISGVTGLGVAAIVTATPAAAYVNAAPCPTQLPPGGAPCYGGDLYVSGGVVHNVYSRAAVICSTQTPFAYQYKYPWPSFRTCMDYYLATNGPSTFAHRKHITDLYIHYHSDLWFWEYFNVLVSVYTDAFEALGRITFAVNEPLVCTFVLGETAGTAAVLGGLACGEAVAAAHAYFHLG